MPVQTEHRFPPDLSVLDAASSRVTLADPRGQARAVAAYFMRTGTCPVCIHHARTLLLQHSGIMLADSAGVARYRLATALPHRQLRRPNAAGRDRPAVRPPTI